MDSPEKMCFPPELTELKKNGVRKAITLLTLEWNDLDTHFDSTQRYMDERFAELESRENRLLSLQDSVTQSNKDLDSIRQSLEERAKEIQHKHLHFCAFQEEQINELKFKEKQLDLIRGSVDESMKEVDLREEKLAAYQRLLEGLFEKVDLEMKQFENIKKIVGKKLEEINLKEKQLESREAMLQSAQKRINDVLDSCSNGKKRKQQSETESKKKHKIFGSSFEEQLDSMKGDKKMSTTKNADFERKTFELRRSLRGLQTTPKHLDGTKDVGNGEFTLSKENASSHLDDEKIYGKVYSSHKKVSVEAFHDFAGERSPGKFQPGQIWAMFNGGLPRKYVQIKKIQNGLSVQSLEPYTLTQPLCCGIFEVQVGRTLHPPSSFLHVVKAKSINKKIFEIYPKKGEVWAIYSNWNAEFSHSNIKNCDYDIVEVLYDTVQSTEVSPLICVSGFKSVFRAAGGQKLNTDRLVIPWVDLGRFRHQIPAFRLTGEKDGKLRGYWELDPAALPGKI